VRPHSRPGRPGLRLRDDREAIRARGRLPGPLRTAPCRAEIGAGVRECRDLRGGAEH
jgi:hypothetical protein